MPALLCCLWCWEVGRVGACLISCGLQRACNDTWFLDREQEPGQAEPFRCVCRRQSAPPVECVLSAEDRDPALAVSPDGGPRCCCSSGGMLAAPCQHVMPRRLCGGKLCTVCLDEPGLCHARCSASGRALSVCTGMPCLTCRPEVPGALRAGLGRLPGLSGCQGWQGVL